ncbi:MAG: response regulator [Phycisphaeraceae bacterium]
MTQSSKLMEKAKARLFHPILIVDDDRIFRTRLVRALEDRGLRTHGAADSAEAVRLMHEIKPVRAIVDLRMAEESGLDVIQKLKAIDPKLAVIVLTGYGSIATAKEAIRRGALDYLTKPADADQILSIFEKADAPQGERATPPESAPSLAQVEWEHIQRVLADCDGNISQAARVLGIHRRSLQRKLSKLPPPEIEG